MQRSIEHRRFLACFWLGTVVQRCSKREIFILQKLALVVVLCIAPGFGTGCATARIRATDASNATNFGSDSQKETLNGNIWKAASTAPIPDNCSGCKATGQGLFWGNSENPAESDNCQRYGLGVVKTSTNPVYFLVSVISLGGWVPFDFEWQCVNAQGFDGETDTIFWLNESHKADNCWGDGFETVKVTTNSKYFFTSILSLGHKVPLDFQWRCAKQPPP